MRGFDLGCLKKYEKDIVFIGSERDGEKDLFCGIAGINCEYRRVADAYEFAQVINGSNLFIGNQSLGLALAEGLKKPRAYEVYSFYDNCRPNSRNGHAFLNEGLLDMYMKN